MNIISIGSKDFNLAADQKQYGKKSEEDQKQCIEAWTYVRKWVLISKDMEPSSLVRYVLPISIPALPAKLNKQQLNDWKAVEAKPLTPAQKECPCPVKVPRLESQVVTAVRFLNENPEKLTEFSSESIEATIGASVWGSIIGGVVGGVNGAGIGYVVGASTFTFLGFIENIDRALTSAQYRNYRMLRQEVLTNEYIKAFIKDDDELCFYVCPEKNELPLEPVTVNCNVINPRGLHFEKTDIEKWLAAHPGQIYPNCKEPFTSQDLQMDLPFMNSAIPRLEKLIQACLNQTELAQVASSLPETLPISLILEYRGYNLNTINPILINVLKLSETLRNSREASVLNIAVQVFTNSNFTAMEKGEILGRLRNRFTLNKIPTIEEPYFFMKWFGSKPKLIGFVASHVETEERSMGEDRKFMDSVLNQHLFRL